MKTITQIYLLMVLPCLFLSTPLFCRTYRITILHTNDLHAQFVPLQVSIIGEPLVSGGFKALHHFLNKERNESTLILDGGDLFAGTILSKITVGRVKGGGLYHLLNKMDYDAMVPGNHDFDQGLEVLRQCQSIAQFDMLCGNIYQGDSLITSKAYRIYKRNHVRIGVIGLTSQNLPHIVARSVLSNVTVQKTAETAQRLIRIIDPMTDLIILLTHQGKEADSLLATKIRGADIIVGGHSHTLIYEPLKVNGILITQAGSRCQYLGKLDVWIDNDAISKQRYRLIPLVPIKRTRDYEFDLLVDRYENHINEKFGQVIGRLKTALNCSRNQESNAGNFVTDAMRQKTEADFAVINSGAIRRNINPGPIDVRDIYDMLPFDNRLMMFQCSGEELLTLMKTNAIKLNKPSEDMLQVSGISYRMGKKGIEKIELVLPRISGKIVDPQKTYTGVSVDYILDGHAKRYFGFKPKRSEYLEYDLAEIVIEAILKNPEVHSEIEGRMR